MGERVKVFCGLDPNELIGFHVFVQSVLSRTDPNKVEIVPVCGSKGTASNAFNKARFEIPFRCGFKGRAVWVDGSDMLCRADIQELPELLETGCDVAVVKHDYSTKYPIKFLGQSNDDYPRKNWSSVIVYDCGNTVWRKVTPEFVNKTKPSELHRFSFLKEDRIGELPKEWNWLVSEYSYNPDAKIAHFTVGLPIWKPYKDCDYADEWREELKKVNYYQQWGEVEAYDDSPMVSER
jgi:hypothetical protein